MTAPSRNQPKPGQPLIHFMAVRHKANQALRCQRVCHHILSADDHASFRGRENAGKELDGGGLPCAIGADKAKHLALFHMQREIIQGLDFSLSLLLTYVFQPNHREHLLFQVPL